MKSYLPLSLVLLSLLATETLAQAANNPPLLGYKPGWTYGTGPSGIEIELVYDLLCTDTLEADPHF